MLHVKDKIQCFLRIEETSFQADIGHNKSLVNETMKISSGKRAETHTHSLTGTEQLICSVGRIWTIHNLSL